MKTVIVLEIETAADITGLADIAAGRIYNYCCTKGGMPDVTARVLDAEEAAVLQQIDAKRERRAYNSSIKATAYSDEPYGFKGRP